MVYLQPLQIIQNKAIRILGTFVHHPVRLKDLSETQTLYIFLNMLNLKQLKGVHAAMWHYGIQSSTNYFHDMGIIEHPTSPSHHVPFKKYRLPPIKSERARCSIRYQIPHTVNKHNLVEMYQSLMSRFSLTKLISKIVLCLDVGIDGYQILVCILLWCSRAGVASSVISYLVGFFFSCRVNFFYAFVLSQPYELALCWGIILFLCFLS